MSHQDAFETVEAAWTSGVRLFDTAPVYGYGKSERRAGVVLAEKPRSEYVVCTKVGRVIEHGGPDGQDIWADPPERLGPRVDYSYAGVFRSFEDSVTRLGIADIDVLHIHDPEQDFTSAVTDAYRAASELRRQGRVRAISIGVNHVDVALSFLREVAASPASGSLDNRVARARAICRTHDVSLMAAALQLPLAHPSVPCVLVGARSPAEIKASTELLAQPIPPECWDDLRAAGVLSDETPTPAA